MENKPKVMFAFLSKWNNNDPQQGYTNDYHILVSTLDETKLANIVLFPCDEFLSRKIIPYDQYFIDACEKIKPDLLFLSPPPNTFGIYPSAETLYKLKRALNIKIVTIYGDLVNIHNFASSDIYAVASDFVIDIASDYYKTLSVFPDKYVSLWTPLPESVFFSDQRDRDLDITFIGGLEGFQQQRKDALDYLESHGIKVHIMNYGCHNIVVSYLDYANYLRRSKITINFSRNKFAPLDQLKGRVTEALSCGAMLLESNNSQIHKILKDGEHFVSFENPEDLLMKLQYFLNNNDKRKYIAESGNRYYKEYLGPYRFWSNVLGRLGLI